MSKIILDGIDLDELLEKISEIIEAKLNKAKSNRKKADDTGLLSRKEVCRLLKISLPTLSEYTKLNWLQSYKIGNRVLYKSDEVEAAIDNVCSNKTKKYTN
ncbi:MAG: DNA-binding protein [Ferruginibacter sp.]|uniref:helix-turn-helix domain-containing protein n=1 Tax=Ferruginibacter sp. TaxID=1940288 RepID=UPI00265996EC|nr:helix-turn-helix domain-containing protein [Ferruginibacter sp.]MDB5275441.1 DNA-binding protein [Ferruginibacter sp.]